MLNFIRIAKIVALLAFVLPWVAVSCQGVDLATASGVELIQGTMTTNPQASEQMAGRFGGMGDLSVTDSGAQDTPDTPDLGMNYFALATALVIVVGLALTFIGAAKTAARNAIVTSLLGAALAFGAVWQFKESVKAESARENPQASATDNPFGDMDGMGQDIIGSLLQERIGYWIVLGALLAAAGAGGLMLAGAGSAAARPTDTPAG